jgi:hypothetical protein
MGNEHMPAAMAIAMRLALEAAAIKLKARIQETGKPLSGVDVDVVLGRLLSALDESVELLAKHEKEGG